ncbi:MAG TPA: condensation domain-containing protein, partial [Thermoanaerobaculia bacterium]|nr:condensation domain-containing protein [Thermoanaerobaculia bacterium]
CATLYDVDARRERFGSPPVTPIGRPVAGAGAYLLDRQGQPVPAGVPGELYVAGAGLARGYLGRPEATAERFVPHPWSALEGERLYRTGDLARRRPDGNLELLGRIDRQIKLRGFRIEPGEIEAALLAHPAVHDAVVTVSAGRLEGREHRRLLAYVVSGKEPAPSGRELRDLLRGRLPGHMVPDACVVLRAWPLTPAGKLDRAALPEPELETAVEGSGAARTPVEELLAGIWEEVLGVERVGVGQSFFELGGHSLLATQVVSRIREAFGIELPLRRVFEQPTVAGLAGEIEAMRSADAAPQLTPIARVDRGGPLPTSFAQERLWFLDRLQPGSPLYNLPLALELRGALRRQALGMSLETVIARHEVLRTRLVVREEAAGEHPVQVIMPPAPCVPPLVDLEGLPAGRREEAAAALAAAEARRPFDLARGPLLRTLLMRLEAERHRFVLTLHHAVADGWSLEILVRELGELYVALALGAEPALPELAVQYADYAAWQRDWLAGEVLERQLGYWRQRLAGAPALLALPTDRPRPTLQSTAGDVLPQTLAGELGAALGALARRRGVTLFMTLLAAFQSVLSRSTGQTDISVGTPIAGRTRTETEDLIGLFVNTLVLRSDLPGESSFDSLLVQVRETTLAAYAHQDLPFEKLVAEISPERNLSHSPLFQVLLVLQNQRRSELSLPDLTLTALEVETRSSKFDLVLNLGEAGGALSGVWRYSTDLFDRATVQRLAGHFSTLLAGAVAEPELRLSELPLLSAAERQQLLEWSVAATPGAAAPFLSERIEAQAARTPGAVAVVCDGRTLTYRDLNRRANRLAHRLLALGAGPGTPVGLCLERSFEMIIGVLAVLKTGGLYVPLDPSYPEERLALLLADARVAVLLTQERLLAALPKLDVPVLAVDARGRRAPRGAGENPAVRMLPDGFIYEIFTSGSTGRPKGASVYHRSFLQLLDWYVEDFGVTAADRFLLVSS